MSSTIFDLPTSVQELPSANAGMARMEYDQVPCTRDLTGNNFPNGAQHFRFTMSGTKRWVPSRSYMRMRITLSNSGNTANLNVTDGIAPNMGLCANLYQSGEFRIQDKTVSRVSDHMAEIDALDVRLNKSKAWLDSTGAVTNFWQADAKERVHAVSSNGVDSKKYDGSYTITSAAIIANGRATGTNTVAWDLTGGAQEQLLTFAIGATAGAPVFNCQNELAVGDYIKFTGGTLINKLLRVVQIPSATTVAVDGGMIVADIDPAVVISTNTFTIYKQGVGSVSSSRRVREFELSWQPPLSIFKCGRALPTGKYELVLNPETAGSYKLKAIEALASLTVTTGYNFSVDDMYMYIATVEGARVDNLTYLIDLDETRCQKQSLNATASLQQKNFDVSPSSYALTMAFQDQAAGSDALYSKSKFKVRADGELGLTRMYINYAGQSKPSPDADPRFTADQKDYTIQRYTESMLGSGSYFDSGGSESIEDWQERGMYFYFPWPRDGTDRSTRVNTNCILNNAAARVMLFDHYKGIAYITIQNGEVRNVRVESA